MSVRTIADNGYQLTVQTIERIDARGAPYWQARAMFRIADGRARADVITTAHHGTRESAESAAVALARRNGWGTS